MFLMIFGFIYFPHDLLESWFMHFKVGYFTAVKNIIQHFLSGLPFEGEIPKSGKVVFNAVLLEINFKNKLKKISPITLD